MPRRPDQQPEERPRQGLLRKGLRALRAIDAGQFQEITARISEAKNAARTAARDVAQLQKLQQRDTEALAKLDDRISGRLEKLNRDTGAALKAVHRTLEQQAGVLGRLVQRFERVDELELQQSRVFRRVDRIGRSVRPVIVGPWMGEVGFELLYWIPFVRWAVERAQVDPGRITVVSRGGTASWYGGLASRYLDLFDYQSPEQVREAATRDPKQRRVRPIDRLLLRAAGRAGIQRAHLLHPSLMYDLFYPVWKQHATVARILEHARYEKPTAIPAIPDGIRTRLPDRYVAVRFYYSDCFPETEENRRVAAEVVRGLAQRVPVVLLNPGVRPDDHSDWEPPPESGVFVLRDDMPANRNLEIQTAVLARASGFAGTYGGFAYLAPLYGVPAVAFYSQRTFYVHHLEVVESVLAPVGGSRLCLIDAAAANFVGMALAGLS